MVVRPPIEKWTRDELEEQLNARLQRYSKDSDASDDSSYCKKYEDLQNQNQILRQKLQLTKQQLIGYVRPTSRLSRRASPYVSKRSRSPKVVPQNKKQKTNAETASNDAKRSLSQSDTGPSTASLISQEKRTELENRKMIEEKRNQSNITLQEKVSLIKLNKQLHERNGEIKTLRWKLKNANEQLEKLRFEHDKVVEEYDDINKRYIGIQKQLQFLQNKTKELSFSKVDGNIFDQEETELLRKEIQTLREANEKLIQNSLMVEPPNGKEKELLNRIANLESCLDEAKTQYLLLVKEMEQQNKQAEVVINDDQTFHAEQQTKKEQEATGNDTSKEGGYNEKFCNDMQHIIASHTASAFITDDITQDLSESDQIDRWKKMYIEIYAELEKTRNMLLLQHNINQHHRHEIQLVNKNCEHYKAQYEQKLSELLKEIEEKNIEIKRLENQIKIIAYHTQKPLEITQSIEEPEYESDEMTLNLKKVIVHEECLKELGTLRPNLFFSIEFFDFELQTTPIFYGPEKELNFSTVYDIVVSNLFVHYIRTEGIQIELYHSQGAKYKLCAVGLISLSPLLSNENAVKLSGTLNLVSPTKGLVLASLFYDVSIKDDLHEALALQEKRSTAVTLLPLTRTDNDEQFIEPSSVQLIVQIHRCTKLDMLTRNKMAPSSYVIYEFYDFNAASTEVVHKNSNPEYNSTRFWTLSNGPELVTYLRIAEICFVVMEEVLGKANSDRQLGYVVIPLYPLSHNNPIVGTFLITASNKEPTVATMDVSIYWKYALTAAKEQITATRGETTAGESTENTTDNMKVTSEGIEKSDSAGDHDPADNERISPLSQTPSLRSPKLLLPGEKILLEQGCSADEEKMSPPQSSLVAESSESQNESNKKVELVDEESPDTSKSTNISEDFSETKNAIPSAENVLAAKHESVPSDWKPLDASESASTTAPLPRPRLTPLAPKSQPMQSLDIKESGKNRPKIVEFKDPLHQSFSISETSSELGDGTISEPSTSQFQSNLPVISASKAFMNQTKEMEADVPNCNLTLIIGQLYVSEGSSLLSSSYNECYITIEWKLLDFFLEECETPEALPLVKSTCVAVNFNYERNGREFLMKKKTFTAYKLTPRRIKLLKQWIELGNRLEFTMVAGDNSEKSDDLGVALLNLKSSLSQQRQTIIFYDIDSMELARMQIEVKFSEELKEQLKM